MPLTLNVDASHADALKHHAKARGTSASKLVSRFIDGLADEPSPPSLGRVIALLREHRSQLQARGISNVAVFGSVARGEEGPGSDIDLMVKTTADADAFDLSAARAELCGLLGAPVEIVTLKEFNASFDRSVQQDVVVAY